MYQVVGRREERVHLQGAGQALFEAAHVAQVGLRSDWLRGGRLSGSCLGLACRPFANHLFSCVHHDDPFANHLFSPVHHDEVRVPRLLVDRAY